MRFRFYRFSLNRWNPSFVPEKPSCLAPLQPPAPDWAREPEGQNQCDGDSVRIAE
ncbi:hypothetical protein HMPREF0293_1447 [Corynebacterium glucuronolyticum ATCC 51866]|uniref:Uncharacterized protein n=1 Tax=Corynebacterium glucuronolyticum ATCC 51866 TaxID=548478 RepID=A0ABP2DTE9_9CORY|nr:hypothetical protein HMPREF0293_1447 [Corynebacterium glucuronolyticum ATCC 51866]